MKIELVQAKNIAELDRLINACIQDRQVNDIKFSSILSDSKIQYTAMIMLGS